MHRGHTKVYYGIKYMLQYKGPLSVLAAFRTKPSINRRSLGLKSGYFMYSIGLCIDAYFNKHIMFTFNVFILTGTSCKTIYDDGIRTSGIYTINPDGQGDFEVYCDLDDTRTDGSSEGGWTVIQKRMDAAVGFYR